MKRLLDHIFVRWICVAVYLFVTATMSGAMVLCEGSDGHVEVEIASLPCPDSGTHNSTSTHLDASPPCHDTLLWAGLEENVPNRRDGVDALSSTFDALCEFTVVCQVTDLKAVAGYTPLLNGWNTIATLNCVILLI